MSAKAVIILMEGLPSLSKAGPAGIAALGAR
jgi:hypothetical protein